ncbi:hypothetical protein BDW59DRAFT_150857 [Aspergillus cavernicola]|uniref:Uncharacterized protein n=1 Tax=Aspergillus cavernicola TaxID=176166 RepID=A0ABR4HYL7_9EURO
MFRKKRSASQHHPQLSTSSTQSAQSAATRAFLKSQPSSNSLSSAAAAAALRSLTPTPTPIENVQTKRMLQRQASLSSQSGGSPSLRPSSRNGLRRVNSSGSMAARTFRDQSPHRPTSSYSTMSAPGIAPPLPSIPPQYNARTNQERRSVSLGPHVWSSTPHTQASGGPINVNSPAAEPESPQSGAGPGVGQASPGHQRSESRNSINFSYPMNSRTNSPTIPSGFPDRRDEAIGALRNDHATQMDVPHNKRPIAQPNKVGRQPGPGSPGRSPRAVGTALAAAQAAIVTRGDEPSTPPVSSRTVRHREHKAYEQSPSRSPASVDIRSRPQIKKPPTIMEDRQTKERSEPEPAKEQKAQLVNKAAFSEEAPRVRTPPISERAPESLRTPPVSPPRSNLMAELDGELQPAQLRQSSSPGRSARFPTQLTVMNLGSEQLHQPPPRSVSPAKSALKVTRNSSLSPDGRIHGILRPGPPLSELSDATSVASDDGIRSNHRRKSVKVSFDDEAEVVGVAASPPTSPEEIVPESPPGKSKSKTSWFGLHKRKSSPLRSTEVDEFDGILKPRAALPSFGSIRATKDGAQPELIQQGVNDNESTLSESDEETPNSSFSNDHAIGNIISRSVQQNGQKQAHIDNEVSAASTDTAARGNAESQEENIPLDDSDSEPAYYPRTPLSPLPEAPSEQSLPLTPNPNLVPPDITLQPATPEIEKGRPSLEEYDDAAEFTLPSVDMEPEAVSQKTGKRRSRGETDDDDSPSIYSDAEEELDGDGLGFGSINAILDHEAASSPSAASECEVATSRNEADEANDTDANGANFPETCRVAHVDTPVLADSETPVSGFPPPIEPLLVSSPYTSFPTQPDDKTNSVQRGIERSSTVPVEVHTIAQVRDGDDPEEVLARYDQAVSNTTQQTRGQNAPPRRKDVKRPEPVELDVNGADSQTLRRQLSNGSDSSSSFRRTRRASRGGMGMRRTLRGSQPSNSVPSSPTRSTVPSVESQPLPSGLGAGTMRTTLRANAPRKEKPSFFSSSKPQKGKPVRAPGTSFASRFPDSDSDSDGGIQNHRLQRPMRNMSDNDMRPVRGIPRRKGAYDGDSTELEDSSDGEGRPTSGPKVSVRQPQPTTVRDPALAAVAKSRGMTEGELEQLLSRGSSRKPTLFNRLSLKKPKPLVQRGKLQPHEPSTNGTIPEHSQVPNQTLQADKTPVTTSPSRLLKKSPHKSSAGDTWPLGSENADPVDSGIGSASSPSTVQQPAPPQTSDRVAVNGNKADSQPPLDQEPFAGGNRASGVVIESSGRKKRFQRLRNAFKIRG